MVTYRAILDVPSDLVSWLENLIAARRSDAGGTWRTLTSWDQAVLLLVWLSKGDTFPQLAAHFGVSTDTAWRYVNKGVEALAALAPTLADALESAGPERRLLLDGTLIPTWRCTAVTAEANPDPLYSGKHREHGMNIQALTGTTGELVFLGQARPGSTHDLTAAGVETTADSGYHSAAGTVRTPIKRPPGKSHNSWERQANSALARFRAPVERAFAKLKRWRVLDTVRISPNRVTALLHALLVTHRQQRSLTRT
ncbi:MULTISPECIES: transposase family protein [Streptomyces]|uniref:transposase family protein n=1 Tax=Streptomyces TaxID=1883 RepID=UPI00345BFD47